MFNVKEKGNCKERKEWNYCRRRNLEKIVTTRLNWT